MIIYILVVLNMTGNNSRGNNNKYMKSLVMFQAHIRYFNFLN